MKKGLAKVTGISILWLVVLGTTGYAQPSFLQRLQKATGAQATEPKVEARLEAVPKGPPGTVRFSLTLKLAPGEYTYSMNPDFGGSTRIQISKLTGLEPMGEDFRPDRPPKAVFEPLLKRTLEKFYDRVTWSRLYRVKPAEADQDLAVAGRVEFQVCDEGSCRQFAKDFVATASLKSLFPQGLNRPSAPAGEPGRDRTTATATPVFDYQVTPTRTVAGRKIREHVTWRFRLEPPDAGPGQRVTLQITARLDDRWHIFAQTQDPANYGNPTVIVIDQLVGLKPLQQAFTPSKKPEIKQTFDGKAQQIHHGEVTWTRQFEVLPTAGPGRYGVSGKVAYQVCDPRTCQTGQVSFALGVVKQNASEKGEGETSPPPSRSASTNTSESGPSARFDLSQIKVKSPATSQKRLAMVLATAFFAGFLLNFMPCVLPVIGLKIMAFIQQSGQSRLRSFLLNLWFSAGLIFVFLVLATLAVSPRVTLGWGEQFSSATFNIILTAVVFVFALSFLDIWEIPIPGLSGSSKAVQLAEREGYTGAFFKGILTTILATPCSGPMLGPALTWAVSQPPHVTYAAFTSVGLGMASPYLVVGLFPRLLAFLPKPGPWMETFKQIMGFVLLGTVVFLLSFLDIPYVVPTVAFLIGLWAACWWVGRTSPTASSEQKLRAWVGACVFAAFVGWVSYGWLYGVMAKRYEEAIAREMITRTPPTVSKGEIRWQPFSRRRLERLLADGKTVFIDFTADW
ncbi:MAG: hypothetical protein GXP27_21720 [Planctomycetes bacterium]|nr:hypothetical protein [Planctomycetota bacterium]